MPLRPRAGTRSAGRAGVASLVPARRLALASRRKPRCRGSSDGGKLPRHRGASLRGRGRDDQPTPEAAGVGERINGEALPAGAQCKVRNVTRPQEGGTVRTLEWLCGSYKVSFVTGVWPQGNTASISIDEQ